MRNAGKSLPISVSSCLKIHLGKVRKYNQRVKLIIGFIYKDEAIFIKARDRLIKRFGRIDFQSEAIDFNYTDYYEKEMGASLKRRFVSFFKLIHIQDLYRIKLCTNRIEARFLMRNGRQVNLPRVSGFSQISTCFHKRLCTQDIFAKRYLCRSNPKL